MRINLEQIRLTIGSFGYQAHLLCASLAEPRTGVGNYFFGNLATWAVR
jgi:hypothetical protein